MPTGYTAGVEDGTITEFKQFALQCARAFGACIRQRDDSVDVLPRELSPDPYYKEQYDKVVNKIQKLTTTTDEDLLKEEKTRLEKELNDVHIIMKNKFLSEDRYRKMLEKAKAWSPPTEDHDNLKEYMIEQLESSIEFDCNPDYYNRQLEDVMGRMNNPKTASELRADKLDQYVTSLKYYSESYEKEVKNVEKTNMWIRSLYKSLEE